MLTQASRALGRRREPRVRLVLGDAHALPFGDTTFDRVFHVGGINGYRDIRRGLAEMERVARPDTPIVVVDEELDPARRHSLMHRLAFASITFFDSSPHAPRELVPAGTHHVAVTRVSRFYYCLTFRTPSRNANPRHIQKEQAMAIGDILTGEQLMKVRSDFDAQQMNALMSAPLSTLHPPSLPYLQTIGDLFYGGPTATMTGSTLPPEIRERCLVAVLATRGAGLNLALHIYLALVAHVSPEEIAHILLLVGTYSGIDNFADAIQTEKKALQTLRGLVEAGSAAPKNVLPAFVAAFPT